MANVEGDSQEQPAPSQTLQTESFSTTFSKMKPQSITPKLVNDKILGEIRQIKKLFDESLSKIRFALAIPQLRKNNYDVIKSCVSSMVIDDVENILKDVNIEGNSQLEAGEYVPRQTQFFSASSVSSVEKLYSEYPEMSEKIFDPQVDQVLKAIHLLYEIPEAKDAILSSDLIEKIPYNCYEIASTLQKLFQHFEYQMSITPQEAEAREVEMAYKFNTHEALMNNVHTLIQDLEPKLVRNYIKVSKGTKYIDLLAEEGNQIKEFCLDSMKKHVIDTDKMISINMKESIKKREATRETYHVVKQKYTDLREDNIRDEETWKIKKHKSQQKLTSILQKYEADMSDRSGTLSELTTNYNKEKEQFDYLEMRYNTQQLLYTEVMEKKLLYEISVRDAKVFEIRKIIAARTIQRFYRAYVNFMNAHGKRRRGKKGKGKKK